MRGLLLVLELVLPLQGLDKGLLGKILGIGGVAYNPINLLKNTAKMVGNKPVLPFQQVQARFHSVVHFDINGGFHVLN